MKTRSCIVPMLLLMCVLVIGTPILGTELRSDVPKGTTVNDEVYMFGQKATVEGTVTSDVLAWAGQVAIPGRVGGSASLAGGSVDVPGSIADNLRAAGGQVTVSGPIGGNAVLAGGTVIIAEKAKVGRDLLIGAGDVRVEGMVGRDARIGAGQVLINGTIAGNVSINADSITLGPKAVIRGNLTYSSPKKAEIQAGAKILGKETVTERKEVRRRPSPVIAIIFWLARLAALYLVGVIGLALAPNAFSRTGDRVFGTPWVSLGVGVIAFIVTPVVALVLLITLIGIPLSFILFTTYLIFLYISRLFVGLAIGRWLMGRLGAGGLSPYLSLLIGLVILGLLSAIPILGWLIHLIALILGLGATVLFRFDLMKELRREGRA